jgi:hypothetical protein
MLGRDRANLSLRPQPLPHLAQPYHAYLLLAHRVELFAQRSPFGDQLRNHLIFGGRESSRHAIDRGLENLRIDGGANGPANGAGRSRRESAVTWARSP